MTSPPVMPRPEDVSTVGIPITTFDGLYEGPGGFGAQLTLARQQALDFRAEFATSGSPDSVETFDLISLPYPTKMGLWRAARTLLFEPSDHELGRHTPYFAALAAKTPKLLQFFPSSELTAHMANPGTRPTFTHHAITHHTARHAA